jgi:hypothetical protein
MTITIPICTVSESNAREHWATKAKRVKSHRRTTRLVLAQHAAPTSACVVSLTRIAPRALDDDNLRGALKACRDGIADWLGVDDRDPRVSWEYEQRKGAAKTYGVEVTWSAAQ